MIVFGCINCWPLKPVIQPGWTLNTIFTFIYYTTRNDDIRVSRDNRFYINLWRQYGEIGEDISSTANLDYLTHDVLAIDSK